MTDDETIPPTVRAANLEGLRLAVAEMLGQGEAWPSHGNVPLAIAASVALAIRERDEARLNDERYRWLRRRNELTEADDPRGPFVIELLDDDTIHHMTGDEIDAAIDAARGKP